MMPAVPAEAVFAAERVGEAVHEGAFSFVRGHEGGLGREAFREGEDFFPADSGGAVLVDRLRRISMARPSDEGIVRVIEVEPSLPSS